MTKKLLLLCVVVFALGLVTLVPAVAQDEFVFGMVLVGPQNDRGWSQAHFEGGQYVEANVPGARMLVFERLNPADSPETTLADVAAEMVNQGAQVIFTASDEFEEDTAAAALAFPEVTFINVSGDDAYSGVQSDGSPTAPNIGNVMGQMEWGKMIAGCAAALTTQTGSISYLGPLINFETRRLVASAYLGARHCYETYRGMDPAELQFAVTWIGFWFNIPGVTLDPTEVTNQFFDGGSDVVISGIDTTEGIVVTGQRRAEGDPVWAVPYDFESACSEAPEVCLGVPYFHWGPAYVEIVSAVQAGTYTQSWDYVGPDWEDINNPDTSAIGYSLEGADGLSEEARTNLEAFIAEMAAYALDPANANSFFLWEGPLAYQDGTELAAEGEMLPMIAPLGEAPSVWYLEQLLMGIEGASST
jgi:simple sugar transport system substrate-binding protein